MNNKLNIYFTSDYASVEVMRDGVSRRVNARTMSDTLRALPSEDRATLVAFCAAVCDFTNDATPGTEAAVVGCFLVAS